MLPGGNGWLSVQRFKSLQKIPVLTPLCWSSTPPTSGSDSFGGLGDPPTALFCASLLGSSPHQRRLRAGGRLWARPFASGSRVALVTYQSAGQSFLSAHVNLLSTSTSSTCHLCWEGHALRPIPVGQAKGTICQALCPAFPGRTELAQLWPPGRSVTAC